MKKRLVLLAMVAVMCLLVCSCSGGNNGDYKNPTHPLNEYSFDAENDWTVVICTDVYGDNGKYYVNDDEASLEEYKNLFIIDAAENADDKSADNLVWIFKNAELVDYASYSRHTFLEEEFEAAFKEVSYEQISELVDLDF